VNGGDGAFDNPRALTYDRGSLYVIDSSLTLSKINLASLEVITIAGAPYKVGVVDGPGETALLSDPQAILADGHDRVWIADRAAGGGGLLRSFDVVRGVMATIAGDGTACHADGTGITAGLHSNGAMAFDGASPLFHRRVRRDGPASRPPGGDREHARRIGRATAERPSCESIRRPTTPKGSGTRPIS